MTGDAYNLAAITNDSTAASGVPHGALLCSFVDAVLTGPASDVAPVRQRIRRELGDAGLVDTCATVASFNAVVKIADGTGIPLEDAKAETSETLREDLGINAFRFSDG